MFLRDFVEQQTVYAHSSQGNYCPMIKCYQTFNDPMSLIQHVLSCPEVPGGEFECWKCLSWHELPTNEKDWSEWGGWKPDLQSGSGFAQKRSLSTKMKETFSLRRRSSARKPSSGSSSIKQDMDTEFQLDARLNPEISGMLNNLAYCRSVCQGTEVEQRDMAGFQDIQKSMKHERNTSVDVDMLWSDISPAEMCALPSTASSTQFEQSPPQQTMSPPMAPNLAQQQLSPPLVDRSIIRSPGHLVSPQTTFNSWQQPGFDCFAHPSSPPIPMNDPILVGELTIPQQVPRTVDLATAAVINDKAPAWLGPRVGGDLARLSPVSWRGTDSNSERSIRDVVAPNVVHMPTNNYPFVVCPPIQAPTPRVVSSGMPMPNTLAITPDMSTANSSQETLHISPANNLYAAPPTHTAARIPPMPIEHTHESRSASPALSEDEHHVHDESSDDLVCDQCQWRPRGVKENLKGYLRKHKNVHKGLRLPCDVPGCKKTFSRLDNLKKHRREKHGVDELGSSHTGPMPTLGECDEHMHLATEAPPTRAGPRDSSEHTRSGVLGDMHSALWPGLHL